jgi:tetratricopeptide (TPR) repeat protein
MPRDSPTPHPAAALAGRRLQQAADLHRQGRLAQAELLYEKVLKVIPAHFEALNSLGMIAAQKGNTRRAVTWFERAVRADPAQVHGHENLGLALHSLMQLNAAIERYDAAIGRHPHHPPLHFNRGNALLELGQLDAALVSYDRAIGLDERYAEAYGNRGVVLNLLERYDAALASFDRAIELRPDYAKAHFNRSLLRLARGEFAAGWQEYEWRLKFERRPAAEGPQHESRPPWFGQVPIDGRTILLRCEQGFGDTLQFCRYARLVAELGGRVILEVQKPLLNLLASLDGVSQFVAQGSPLPSHDYHGTLMSLPFAFKTRLDTIPREQRYLTSDPAKRAHWQAKLGPRKVPRVGLAWSGSATNRNERNRSFPLADLLPYLPGGFEYFSLQKEPRESDLPALRSSPRIADCSADLHDFADTAALCDCMDLVISTCTSVAHLSAALGRSTWILLGHAPDWRWLMGRDDSPWYPSVKLYRRQTSDAWGDVFARVAGDMVRLLV